MGVDITWKTRKIIRIEFFHAIHLFLKKLIFINIYIYKYYLL